MGTLSLNREPINIDIEPATFAASSLNPFGMSVGKLTLEVDREGFRLLNKKGKLISTVPWDELEGFENEVREKARFAFRGTITGVTDVTGKVRVGLRQQEDHEKLTAIFDKLPAELRDRKIKCGACGGTIVNNLCQSCGESFTGQQRRKGLKYIAIGIGLMFLGILLTYSMYSESSSYMLVFYGPIVLGAGLIIAGLIALIFGKRVD
jgi:uncharacterized membrane protein